jgi:hypothetical protein
LALNDDADETAKADFYKLVRDDLRGIPARLIELPRLAKWALVGGNLLKEADDEERLSRERARTYSWEE